MAELVTNDAIPGYEAGMNPYMPADHYALDCNDEGVICDLSPAGSSSYARKPDQTHQDDAGNSGNAQPISQTAAMYTPGQNPFSVDATERMHYLGDAGRRREGGAGAVRTLGGIPMTWIFAAVAALVFLVVLKRA